MAFAGGRRNSAIRRRASFVARSVSGACDAMVVAQIADHVVDDGVIGNAGDQSEGFRLVRIDQPRGEEEILGATRAEQVDETGQVGGREAVTQCPRNRHAKLRGGRAHAQIAGERDRAAATCGNPVHLRDCRNRNALEAIDHLVQPALVGDTIVSGRELRELLNVRARGKRVAIGTHNQNADGRVARPRVRTPRRSHRTLPT